MTGTNRAVVCFYNQPGTAEQRIKEGKAPTQLTGLLCHRFRANELCPLLGPLQNLQAQKLMGIIFERKGDVANGQQTLEKLLTLNPRFAPAANNLAWLYREHGGDKEKALEVAQRTKEAVHDDLHISDTPGWIRYQQGVYQRAASLLKESAAKLPDNPVIHMYRRL